jgi:hypothetical protein
MKPNEIAPRDRRQRWDVRTRIEQLEALAAQGKNGFPPAPGAKALVREQSRRAEAERPSSEGSMPVAN